jgi:UDP-3-O-[3-hydroxymyristoyl] glucosamine N-acyltransferase
MGGWPVPTLTLDHVAHAIGASLVGDGSQVVTGLASLQDARSGQLSFLANRRYVAQAITCDASALIVPLDFSGNGRYALLKVPDPYIAYVTAAVLFEERELPPAGVHPSTVVARGVRLGARASVGPHCVLDAGARLGDDVVVGPTCYIGKDVEVGDGTRLAPGVRLLAGTVVGRRCILQSGTVVGSDGFGYVSGREGHRRIPQLGRVRIEDDVEIGANCTIDRGSLGETRIGRGSKLDNLVHVAHNVDVGEQALLVAQVGISGSTRIGDRVVLAGQVGVAGHLEIGAGSRVGGQSGVSKSIPPGKEWFGYPARERRQVFRLHALYSKLPELYDRLKRLEELLEERRRAPDRPPPSSGDSR